MSCPELPTPIRVLLVEDDVADRLAVKRHLASSANPVKLTESAGAEEALALLEQGDFDCVLLDFNLPGHDGLYLLRQLRARGLRTPVVMITGQEDAEVAAALMKGGASDYLAKNTFTADRIQKSLWHAVELHRAQEEARSAQEALKRRVEFEQQLVGIVSHDLRNPLHAIGISSEMLLRREDLDDRTVKSLNRIRASAQRAARMIRDLLDFTRARLGGGIPLERKSVDLSQVVSQAVEEVGLAYPDRTLELITSGPMEGHWDPDRVAQLVSNLTSNAIQYSPSESAVRVMLRYQAPSAVLEVHNFGDAIPPDRLPSIFEPLQRVAPTIDTATRSIGLGLYIVRHIVEAHGGRIEVSSSREEGTRFIAHLPQ